MMRPDIQADAELVAEKLLHIEVKKDRRRFWHKTMGLQTIDRFVLTGNGSFEIIEAMRGRKFVMRIDQNPSLEAYAYEVWFQTTFRDYTAAAKDLPEAILRAAAQALRGKDDE